VFCLLVVLVKLSLLAKLLARKTPLSSGRCTSLLRVVVSEMTYTVSSGTLNSTIPCHAESLISQRLLLALLLIRKWSVQWFHVARVTY